MTQPAIDSPGTEPGTADAGTGAPAQGNVGGGVPATAPGWLDGVSPDLAEFAKSQNWSKPDEALASARGHLKLRGVPERELMRLPEKWEENPETANAVWSRLGRPEKPEEYEIPDVAVALGDTNIADEFKKWAHDAGLSRTQAKKLATHYQAKITALTQGSTEAMDARNLQEEQALRAEWGGTYDENFKAGSTAANAIQAAIGLTGDDLTSMQNAIGYGKTVKMMALMGRTMGEHKTVTSEGGELEQFGMTPAAAGRKADQLTVEVASMKREDPGYQAKLDQLMMFRHLSTGEAVPSHLRHPGDRG